SSPCSPVCSTTPYDSVRRNSEISFYTMEKSFRSRRRMILRVLRSYGNTTRSGQELILALDALLEPNRLYTFRTQRRNVLISTAIHCGWQRSKFWVLGPSLGCRCSKKSS